MSDPKLPELWLIHDTTENVLYDNYFCLIGDFPSQEAAQAAIDSESPDAVLCCTPVRVLPPPDTLAALLADSRWQQHWELIGMWAWVGSGGKGKAFVWQVKDYRDFNVTESSHPTPEAAVRAALETKGGA